jgi:hypothetical protein
MWTARLTIKHRLYQDDQERRCELRAIPSGRIKYTTDGSSPATSGLEYVAPFIVPTGTKMVLAAAETDGTESEAVRFDLPEAGKEVAVDLRQRARWRHVHDRDDTASSYAFLQAALARNAMLGGVKLTVMHDKRWTQFMSSEDLLLTTSMVTEEANRLKSMVVDGNLDLQVKSIEFETGADLIGMVADLKMQLTAGEVAQ